MPHTTCERRVRICERNNSADTEASQNGRGGGAPATRAEISLQPMVKAMVKQVVPLQPMENQTRADIHPAACGGLYAGAGECALREAAALGKPMQERAPARTCGPMERRPHARAGFSGRACDPVGTHTGEVCSWRTVPHGKDPCWTSS